MKRSNEAYFGIDNMEEVTVLFTKKQRRDITKVAKQFKIPEVELLGRYIEQISIAGLAGVAAAMQQGKKNRRSK